MRTANFRDFVLHPIAYAMGLDPHVDLVDDEAIATGKVINAWIRRLWTSVDFPEWSNTLQAAPVNHIVKAAIATSDGTLIIGKVLSVHLLDPRVSNTPADVPFTEISEGIHVGFDHGSSVWIKYLPAEPLFSAEKWDAGRVYQKGEATYYTRTGECYVSRLNNNRNHEPITDEFSHSPLTVEQTQQVVLGSLGNPGVPGEWTIEIAPDASSDLVPPTMRSYSVQVLSTAWSFATEIANVSQATDGVLTYAEITQLLVDQLVLVPALAAYAIVAEAATIRVTHSSGFGLTGRLVTTVGPDDIYTNLETTQVASYSPVVLPIDGIPQISKLTVPTESVIPGSEYILTLFTEDGLEHVVSYAAVEGDSGPSVVNALSNAILLAGSSDPVFSSFSTVVDPVLSSLTLSRNLQFGMDAIYQLAGNNPYWAISRFPYVLIEPVVTGSIGDLRKEWGQYEEGAADQQGMAAEVGLKTTVGNEQQYEDPTARASRVGRYSVT